MNERFRNHLKSLGMSDEDLDTMEKGEVSRRQIAMEVCKSPRQGSFEYSRKTLAEFFLKDLEDTGIPLRFMTLDDQDRCTARFVIGYLTHLRSKREKGEQ